MPKHHAGGLLLKVEQVQAAANFSVIICGEHRRSPSVEAELGRTTPRGTTPCRSSAGLVSWAISRGRAYAQTKPSPPERVVVVVSMSRANIEAIDIRAT
jgi:hypothetical protein